ncbi:MAG: sialidase family protein [Halioglobus sp.]
MTNLIRSLITLSAIAQCVFLYLFVLRNSPGLSSPLAFSIIAIAYGTLFIALCYVVVKTSGSRQKADGGSVLVSRILMIPLSGIIVLVFVDATVTDYYQPLSLYDDAIAALAVSWASLVLAALSIATRGAQNSLEMLRSSIALIVLALLGWPLAASLTFINQPAFGADTTDVRHIFVGGQHGYDIYRIPALLFLPAGSALASGETLSSGRLIAFAEARRDGSLDTGVIDLVMRHSDDDGKSWSEQQLVCRHETEKGRGKCGNATPVFDADAGNIILAYNLSGVEQSDQVDQAGVFHTGNVIFSGDAGATWTDPIQVTDDNFVFGPGHGIQKRLAPATGRLLLPGYLSRHAMVLFSDDNGATWHRSAPLDTGNETELAELGDGALYMTTRHRASIGRPPQPNGRLYSRSVDGGKHWTNTQTQTDLPTPVCQASVLAYESKLLLFSNPSHPKSRVNMEIKLSDDGGSSWPGTIPVFSGPSGYSQLAQNEAGAVFVLFENGVMSYSERITLVRVPAAAIPL